MARPGSKRRDNPEWPWRGDTSTSLAQPSHALTSQEPRLGRGFIEGDRNGRQDDEGLTVSSYLIGKLGTRGYGRLLQRLDQGAPPRQKPKARRRRPRRKAVAA